MDVATRARIDSIRSQYVTDRAVFISGPEMVSILTGLGATGADLIDLRTMGEDLAPDPTLPFRRSRNGRFAYDYLRKQVRRLGRQPFVLSVEEDFVRHDSGMVREFEQVDELQANTGFQALLRFNAMVIEGVEVTKRPKLDYVSREMICTAFALRTITNADLQGEPALEGVHTDGVDHTMTTFVDATNLTDSSGVTRMHSMLEKAGTAWDQANPELIIGQVHHTRFLDTLIVVDNERKHSVTPVTAKDPEQEATRDMLIFFSRHPVQEGHVSRPYDSLQDHEMCALSLGFSH